MLDAANGGYGKGDVSVWLDHMCCVRRSCAQLPSVPISICVYAHAMVRRRECFQLHRRCSVAWQVRFHLGLEGSFGANKVTPRQLMASHLGQLVCVEGIVTKCTPSVLACATLWFSRALEPAA